MPESPAHNKILEIETRKKLYFLVKKLAGSHFRAIQRESGLSVGSVQHHLHYLVKKGMLKESRLHNTVVYFPLDVTSNDAHILSLLRQEPIRKILLFLTIEKKPSQDTIARFVHSSPSTVSWHLKRLHEQRIITPEKKGRHTHYRLTFDEESLIKLLITYQESFLDSLVDRVVEMWAT